MDVTGSAGALAQATPERQCRRPRRGEGRQPRINPTPAQISISLRVAFLVMDAGVR